MTPGSVEPPHDRLEKITEMKAGRFCYGRLCEAIVDELESDEQFLYLLALSERARQVVEIRESLVGYDDPMRAAIVEFGEVLDEEIHRRADEIITELCASLVRQDDRWIADDPDSVDTTQIQAAYDAIQQSRWWLNDHEEIVDRLDISYPEDKG